MNSSRMVRARGTTEAYLRLLIGRELGRRRFSYTCLGNHFARSVGVCASRQRIDLVLVEVTQKPRAPPPPYSVQYPMADSLCCRIDRTTPPQSLFAIAAEEGAAYSD